MIWAWNGKRAIGVFGCLGMCCCKVFGITSSCSTHQSRPNVQNLCISTFTHFVLYLTLIDSSNREYSWEGVAIASIQPYKE